MEIEVKGHSGCSVDIIKENNELFILKKTIDKNYFKRLVLQAEKQIAANSKEYKFILVPRVFQVYKNNEFCSVKMEYVYSKNFVEYFESAGFEQVESFVRAIKSLIEYEIKNSKVIRVHSTEMFNKFSSVKKSISKNNLLNCDVEIIEIIDKSSKILLSLPLSMEIPIGECHGDLTLSNVLFSGNNFYLIDFLDSFIESPLIDMVKIRQDTAYLWSALMYDKEFDELRLNITIDKIDKELDIFFSNYKWYNEFYKSFQLMNFLRILQYANDITVVEYLKKIIKIHLL